MSKENKGRIRHVCKFGKQGKFDAYDGRPEGKNFLEPFIELSAFEKCQAENKKLKDKIEKIKSVISDEDLACADCVEAKAEGYTICGECSVE